MGASSPLFPALDARLRRAARRLALGGTGLALVLLGAGFLIAALWAVMAAAWGAPLASAAVGAVLAGLGLILLGVAIRKPPTADSTAAPGAPQQDRSDAALRRLLREAGLEVPPKGSPPPLTEAFLFGLIVALRLRRGGR